MTFNDNTANLSHMPDEAAFDGRFTNFNQIGAGGMGSVYKAHDTVLNKTVAIKVLQIEHGRNEKYIARLQKEAKALARLSHPSIIAILDFGLTSNDEPYMIMEFLNGYTLDTYLKSEDYLNWDDTISIFEQVANALIYAHEKGIIHRDLKPSNIFILESDSNAKEVKIIDFGISAIVESDQGQTTSGTMIGSPLYMSPEQTESSHVDERSDIYSFGCIVFRSLTGKMPIEGSSVNETILLKRTTQPEKLSDSRPGVDFSKTLEELVDKCLQINPDDRFNNMSEVVKAMDKTLQIDPQEESQNEEKTSGISKLQISFALVTLTVTILFLVLFSASTDKSETSVTTEPEEELEGLARTVSKANVEETFFRDKPVAKPFTDSEGNAWVILTGNVDADFIKNQKKYDFIQLYHLHANITDEILEALVAKKPLGLNLNKTGITDRQIPIITKLPDLEYLSMGGCSDVTAKSIPYLLKFKSLYSLGLSGKHLSGKEMKLIASLPNLATLHFSGQRKFQKNAISSLKRDKPFRTLGITGADLTDEELRVLATNISTSSLAFNKITFKDDQLAIIAKTKASGLTLAECRFAKDELKDLATNKSLRSVVLVKCHFVSASDLTYLKNTMGARCKFNIVTE